jgi:beta-lactam-binding protein with PASTA domain
VPVPTAPKPLTDQETAIVPNLKGMPLKDAEKTLLDLDLKYKYFIEVNEQFPGSVFKQELPADQKVEKGTVVIFYVGK